MLKVLLKKQLAEVFKGYFFDAKKNRMRSKASIAAYFLLFIVVMVGMLGGIFTMLALSLCDGLVSVGMGWLYFLLMGGIAILLGAFGSVFNSYAGLYLAKDNDLLLSLPIPVRTIMTARLMNVYLMGLMYSATVLIPTLVVYWIVAGATVSNVLGGILFFLIVTIIILLLSCLLGWVVAKISLRLKNRSFITVLISLLFLGAYYFFYFKANDMIRNMLLNAEVYGEKIKGAAYGLYLFGRIGEGDWMAAGIFTAILAVLSALLWRAMSRSFLKIATSSGAVSKVRYVEKRAKERSAFGALLSKEFARFTSSATYMLNCGLGLLFLPAAGILLLLQGKTFFGALEGVLAGRPGSAVVLICAMFFMMLAMVDVAAPSVSLEGKSIWIPQSLPVEPKTVLRAKLSVQLILSVIAMLFASVCAAIALPMSVEIRLLVVLVSLAGAVFASVFNLFVGVKMPVLTWTNEMTPIKQSGAVAIALFSGWGFAVVMGGLYFLIGYKLGAVLYLLIWTVLLLAVSFAMLRWLDTKGSRSFAAL